MQILEVALEALENVLEFGQGVKQLLNQPGNVCLELVRQCDGFTYLATLHQINQGFGSFAVWEKSGQLLSQWGNSD